MARSGQPLRILIGCDTFAPDLNGAASFAKRLAVGLVQRGHEVHIAAPSHTGRGGTWTEVHDGVELTVHRLLSWRWLPHPWLRFALPWRVKANGRKLVKRVRPDVVHFQSHIVIGQGLAVAARRAGVRLIGTNHTMAENIAQHITILPPPLLRWLIRAQWRSAAMTFGLSDAVTTPTRRSSDYFEVMTGLSGVHSISNGIDAAEYTPNFSRQVENRIVYVGRLDEEKCVHELIHALARLDPALRAKVDIVGGGADRVRLESLARRLSLEDRVLFHGCLNDQDLRAVLSRGSVFAMPSRAELQGMAVMEAMATALPVVAANAMALPHLVHPGVNGYLYEPGDIDEFAAHLTTVMAASDADRAALKSGSQKLIASHSLASTLDAYESLYRGHATPSLIAFEPLSSAEAAVHELVPTTFLPLSEQARQWITRRSSGSARSARRRDQEEGS